MWQQNRQHVWYRCYLSQMQFVAYVANYLLLIKNNKYMNK
nr:MAG TPA: hypothetical protein [Bacteriophage sp.]